jgi:hypothetical protein
MKILRFSSRRWGRHPPQCEHLPLDRKLLLAVAKCDSVMCNIMRRLGKWLRLVDCQPRLVR